MQIKVKRSKKLIGKSYRNVRKIARLRKKHRKTIRANRNKRKKS